MAYICIYIYKARTMQCVFAHINTAKSFLSKRSVISSYEYYTVNTYRHPPSPKCLPPPGVNVSEVSEVLEVSEVSEVSEMSEVSEVSKVSVVSELSSSVSVSRLHLRN